MKRCRYVGSVKEEHFEEGVEGPVLSKGLGESELRKKGGGGGVVISNRRWRRY